MSLKDSFDEKQFYIIAYLPWIHEQTFANFRYLISNFLSKNTLNINNKYKNKKNETF